MTMSARVRKMALPSNCDLSDVEMICDNVLGCLEDLDRSRVVSRVTSREDVDESTIGDLISLDCQSLVFLLGVFLRLVQLVGHFLLLLMGEQIGVIDKAMSHIPLPEVGQHSQQVQIQHLVERRFGLDVVTAIVVIGDNELFQVVGHQFRVGIMSDGQRSQQSQNSGMNVASSSRGRHQLVPDRPGSQLSSQKLSSLVPLARIAAAEIPCAVQQSLSRLFARSVQNRQVQRPHLDPQRQRNIVGVFGVQHGRAVLLCALGGDLIEKRPNQLVRVVKVLVDKFPRRLPKRLVHLVHLGRGSLVHCRYETAACVVFCLFKVVSETQRISSLPRYMHRELNTAGVVWGCGGKHM
ncbi:peroxisomal biogenesis factor 9 [Yarrowia lipolytica]|uniref:Peroxisomal biogenesis factor 9 n=1 Tax=Yarrowia lipolytica TaxID=4952 RepID=A0A371C4Y3_YARLL|nr:peroxisomal biogenesis factor 9 [Yarrowia lipolytica]RDW33967.1 peroxisomal biogenesis factor 9 [Yarrowia lipolytica]RDW41581.1 peroxisomal biogenesis factor 9 [Yarrowia lipolytica]RDW44628.1 peroxisomal biogenesis factor 9 [Yarrowia lipolytica]RDW51569.1 peroxisomal biogenesis factor 9 [Yarrowia lipolytica]